MKDNRKTIQVLVILTMIFTVMGGSLAYWNWSSATSQKTNIVFTSTAGFSCAADGGGNITASNVKLAPTTCTDASRAIKRKVIVTPTLDRDNLTVSLDLWLTINELGEGLKKSNNFRYVLTTSSTSCEEGEIISEGNFKGRKPGDKIRLITNDLHTVTPTPEEYYLYIWLDAEETNSNTMNQRFSMSLGGVCDEVETLVGDAYAVYSNTDYSLRFYRSTTPITKGSTYNGKVVTEVWTGFEETGEAPWRNEHPEGYSEGYYLDFFTKIVFEDTVVPEGSIDNWFAGFSYTSYMVGLNLIDVSKLNTSQVTSMQGTFSQIPYYGGVNIIGLENWDTSKVENMSYMFQNFGYGRYSSSLTLNGMENWDTSNVIDMSFMFDQVDIVNDSSAVTIQLPNFSNWDVSKVTNMSSMFSNIAGLTNYTSNVYISGLGNWNVSNVINMSNMFKNFAKNSINDWILNLSSWDVSSVIDSTNFRSICESNYVDGSYIETCTGDNAKITSPRFGM